LIYPLKIVIFHRYVSLPGRVMVMDHDGFYFNGTCDMASEAIQNIKMDLKEKHL
jgi:hypothetical protein